MNQYSWQCEDCLHTHDKIVLSNKVLTKTKKCPECNGVMYPYELKDGIKTQVNKS